MKQEEKFVRSKGSKVFFTADEHYFHSNIIRFCNRPYKDVYEMNDDLIAKHNSVVSSKDTVYHLGDFTLGSKESAEKIIRRLNGKHVFIRGSHDKWLNGIYAPLMLEMNFGNKMNVVLSHYAMRTWRRSHYGEYQVYGHSHEGVPYTGFWGKLFWCFLGIWKFFNPEAYQLYGHSHGNLPPRGKQLDVGVDSNGFYPISLEDVVKRIEENESK